MGFVVLLNVTRYPTASIPRNTTNYNYQIGEKQQQHYVILVIVHMKSSCFILCFVTRDIFDGGAVCF